jgi:DNA polymerase-3 subunit alpha
MPALGLADSGNLFGALEFAETMAGKGIQPLVGCALNVDFGDAPTDSRAARIGHNEPRSVVLISLNEAGYGNLVRLVSESFLRTDAALKPQVAFSRLADCADGLVVLTGGPDGPINGAVLSGRLDDAAARLDRLHAAFGDRLYVELQRHGTAAEASAEPILIDFAHRRRLPLVATKRTLFPGARGLRGARCTDRNRRGNRHRRREAPAADARALLQVARRDGVAVRRSAEATDNTIEIAMRANWWPRTRKPILPRFAEGAATREEAERVEAVMLREQARAGLAARLATHGLAPGLTEADYRERLEYELGVIESMKFPGYFLIVADFIQWAKRQEIPVGPGRGSGAGSLVAWSLTITDLDPLRFSLIFERFLNPDRVSMPDFDVDFCQNRRDEVIRYVQEKYGADHVAQIITFGTLQARAVLRDVGRVLQMPYGQVDRIAKMVPQNPANPVHLDKAIADEPRFELERKADDAVDRLLTIAQKLEGLYRHASTHAAGVVIGDRPLIELVPLYRDPRSGSAVSQFNMKWVEQAGLVKFDFLGLKTLTVLDLAVKLLRRRGVELDLGRIPLDDAKSYEMMRRGEVVGVFQVESGGMRRALIDMQPDRFEDLIALVALYRPGPMANIPSYCLRKRGKEKVEYAHPVLVPILAPTYGIITYQEQVQQIARDLAGYTLAEADLLRRAMGKKIRAEMAAQRDRFMKGAMERGVGRDIAEAIFDACAKFAEYGFNKSHSAPYGLITYQTAYMKANYPVEFLAASLTLEAGNTDKLAEFRREAIRLGITVEPPSVNRSGVDFEVVDGRIVYALAALKGVGAQAVEHLVTVRAGLPFRDPRDFARRISPRMINKRTLESLVAAGALDELEPDRARLHAGVDRILGMANYAQENAASGQGDIFGGSDERPLLLPVSSRGRRRKS